MLKVKFSSAKYILTFMMFENFKKCIQKRRMTKRPQLKSSKSLSVNILDQLHEAERRCSERIENARIMRKKVTCEAKEAAKREIEKIKLTYEEDLRRKFESLSRIEFKRKNN